MKSAGAFLKGPRIPLRTGALMIALVGMAVFLFILLISPQDEEIAFSQPKTESTAQHNVEALSAEEPTTDASTGDAETGPDTTVTAHLVGAVANPGIVMLKDGARVFEAIAEAGGFTQNAAPEALNLAEPVVDGAQIRVPTKAEAKHMGSETPAGQKAPDQQNQKSAVSGGQETPGASDAKVNVNTADSVALQQLPGVGPATAGKIIEHREQFGPFANADELTAVRGIGPATVEKLRDRLNF